MQKKVNILISGGSGFLGSNLVNFLFKQKYNLYLLKRSVQIFLELIKIFLENKFYSISKQKFS